MSNKMTRQRKWLLGVLGVGVAAVVVDRAMLGGPDTASASDAADTPAAPAPEAALELVGEAAPEATVGAAGPIDLSDFALQLEAIPPASARGLGRADVFESPAGWAVEIESPGVETQSVAADGSLVREFQAEHAHNGTMYRGGVEYVLLSGQPVVVGQIVEGFVLKEFNDNASLWESTVTGERVVLRDEP